MTAALPTAFPDASEVVPDDALSWLVSLDPSVIAVLGGLLVVLLLVAALAGWLVLRRIRRSALAARGRELAVRGRELGVQGVAAVAANRLPPGQRRSAAELQLKIAGARGQLRRQVATAQAADAHLGDVPGLLPALEAEGTRLEQRLLQRTLSTSATVEPDLETEAGKYLDMLAEVCDAVLQAERAVPAAGQLSTDVADVVTGLRAYTAAYQELTGPPVLPPVPPMPPEPPVREATER